MFINIYIQNVPQKYCLKCNKLIKDPYKFANYQIENYSQKDIKIAIYNGFDFHYEMFGYIIAYCIYKNYKLDIYTNLSNNIGWIEFYEKLFPKSFKIIDKKYYNHENKYDKIILTTDDDNYFLDNWINDKIIAIDHTHVNRRNKVKIHIGTRFYIDRPSMDWILPVYRMIDLETKKKISKKNIVFIGRNSTVNLDYLKKFNNFNNYNFILVSRNINFKQFNGIKNIKTYNWLSTSEMINMMKESDYVFISDHNKNHFHKSMSASIPLALNCLCTMLIPEEMNKHYKFKSVITYKNNIIIKNPNYELVNQDLVQMIKHRNQIFDKYI
jgi:hypothetical protein